MYTSKRNILETVALLKAHGISRVVLSPGSRNAPLIQSFICDSFFDCISIIDERSAGYLALGLALQDHQPVVLCCTSGSALLNYAPALAEAFYQHVPLIVLSADRQAAWIDQMDGQTLPQPGIFGPLVKQTVHLPEVQDDTTRWHCNRLINEAILTCQRPSKGPVHLNIPISEPLFDFSEPTLPVVRVMEEIITTHGQCPEALVNAWNKAQKRLVLVGQHPTDSTLTSLLDTLATRFDCVILGEHLSNVDSKALIGNFDTLLAHLDTETTDHLRPDFLLTLGGHVISKRLKQWLRQQETLEHWAISSNEKVADSYQHLGQYIKAPANEVLAALAMQASHEAGHQYADHWNHLSRRLPAPTPSALPFSDLAVTGYFLHQLPTDAALLVGNSSPVRNIQYYPKPALKTVYCNRGTNGIEGSLSLATGLTLHADTHLYALLGDLSFIHDLGSLWTAQELAQNLKILLINNGGGGIFHHLNGLELSPTLLPYIAANHDRRLEHWVKAAGWDYLEASGHQSLAAVLPSFTDTTRSRPIVLEVFTDPASNKAAFDVYTSTLQTTLP